MTRTNSPVRVTFVGDTSLAELGAAVRRVQNHDPFTRVVVIADHRDVATALRHHLGASGVLNVTVQTGRHLAAELAAPVLRTGLTDHGLPRKPLTRLLEHQAVRMVTEARIREYGFQSDGVRRLRSSLATAFRRMQERPLADDDAIKPPGEMNELAETLLEEYLELVHRMGRYTAQELPAVAAGAVAARDSSHRVLPHVIYYLPRRLSEGDVILANALLEGGRCEVILGLTGEDETDEPVRELLDRLIGGVPYNSPSNSPLAQIVDGGNLSIVAAPDTDEEVRTVMRSIAADDAPFHRTAIIYRQDNPYSSLLRQELDSAGIPYSRTESRTLASTPSGLLILGLVDMAVELAEGQGIERDRLTDWITSTPVRYEIEAGEGERSRRVPGSRWAELARQARANGPPERWNERLRALIRQEEARSVELNGELTQRFRRERQQAEELAQFVVGLAKSLEMLGRSGECDWESASRLLRELLRNYRWAAADEPAEARLQIGEIIESVSELQEWGEEFNARTLRQVVHEELRSPVTDRGRPVGAGVYLGPPAGVAGADYSRMYVVGMVEKQYPQRAAIDPWLAASPYWSRRELALERYDFMAALASADRVVLSWPATTAERTASYPSRWLVEAANLLHPKTGGEGRLAYDSITTDVSERPWLTFIPSREAGLRRLADYNMEPADLSDYNLTRMVSLPVGSLSEHPAVALDDRMADALESRAARGSSVLTRWDGLIGPVGRQIEDLGSVERPVSPSALETWGTCPYRYFLSRVLGISAPTDDAAAELSPMERGLLVHRVLERFVEDEADTEERLLALADEEFDDAERRGQTGYQLLWEITKDEIREGLRGFLANDREWLGEAPAYSAAEVGFGPEAGSQDVQIEVEELGEISFRGKIDRVDVLTDEVRVRDFKTGRPDPYRDGRRARRADRTVANGLALQLPVYLEAAQAMHPGKRVTASYCFPLSDRNTHGVGTYTEDDREQFVDTLRLILGTIRKGVFPATPEGSPDGRGTNCSYCDFNRLCPSSRRQTWERKGRSDSAVRPFNDLGNRGSMAEETDAAE